MAKRSIGLWSALLVSSVLVSPAQAARLAMVGGVSTQQTVGFDVVLPLRDLAAAEALVKQQHDPSSALFHKWLKPEAFIQRFGPTDDAIQQASRALASAGLSVGVEGRVLHASGQSAAVAKALGTSLAIGRTASGHERVFASRAVQVPNAISALGGRVLGLGDQDHERHPFSRTVQLPKGLADGTLNRTSTSGAYWYNDLKQAYQYPSYQTMITVNGKQQRLDGTGATIGIVMSSDVYDSDISMVFNHENFKSSSGQASTPRLYKRVLVNGGGTLDDPGALGEASLDVQEALTGAPGAHVILYSIPDLGDRNILDAYLRIVSDNVADVVSSSFGACELLYTPAYNEGVDYTGDLQTEHELFVQGNAQGITFLASSGDEAGLECPTANYYNNGTAGTYVASVSTPASDPNVTAVGGTNVVTAHTAGSLDSTYLRENAYGDPETPLDPISNGAPVSGGYWGAGGGVSTIFAKPDYQKGSLNTGSSLYRALPDIGMQVGGCPGGEAVTPCNGGNSPLNGNGNTDRSDVVVAEGGSFVGLIGTSVASPEFSAVAALLVEQYGRMGNLNTYLYQLGRTQSASGSNAASRSTTVFHRNIPGYNGVVTNNQPVNTGGNYFNYTVGLGTPLVYRLVGAANATPAGLPQTNSNP